MATVTKKLTLFINPTCHLCSIARHALQSAQTRLATRNDNDDDDYEGVDHVDSSDRVRDGRMAIDWEEVDITRPGQEHWRDNYCFDVRLSLPTCN